MKDNKNFDSRESTVMIVPAGDSVSHSSVIASSGLQTEKGVFASNAPIDEVIEVTKRSLSLASKIGVRISQAPPKLSSSFYPIHPLMQKIGATQTPDDRKPAYYTKVLLKREHMRASSVPTAMRTKLIAYPQVTQTPYLCLGSQQLQEGEDALVSILLRNPRHRHPNSLTKQSWQVHKPLISKLAARQRFPQASDSVYYGSEQNH
jgi:hypothetical protein